MPREVSAFGALPLDVGSAVALGCALACGETCVSSLGGFSPPPHAESATTNENERSATRMTETLTYSSANRLNVRGLGFPREMNRLRATGVNREG